MAFGNLKNWYRKAYDQVNPFDNNRTWQQRTPTQSKSTFQQAGQLGGQVSRGVIGSSARFLNTAEATRQQIAPTFKGVLAQASNNPVALSNAISEQNRLRNQYYGKNKGILGTGTFVTADEAMRGDPKTILARTGANTLETGLELASLGTGGFAGKELVTQGFKQGFKSQVPNIVKSGALNTAQGGVHAFNEGVRDPKEILKQAAIGGTLGTAADVGLGVLGAGLTKGGSKLIKGSSEPTIKISNKPRISDAELDNLKNYSDYLMGLETPNNRTSADAYVTAKKAGLDITSGSRAARAERINQLLDREYPVRKAKENTILQTNRVGKAIQRQLDGESKTVSDLNPLSNQPTIPKVSPAQGKSVTSSKKSIADLFKDEGGYVRLPGKDDPYIQEYADFLKSVGEGNGVSINPETGVRITNNVRFGDTKGKRMTKADWYAEAERQINTGTADKAFMDYYKEMNNPEIQSLLQEAQSGKFGKQPLGEVAQQPTLGSSTSPGLFASSPRNSDLVPTIKSEGQQKISLKSPSQQGNLPGQANSQNSLVNITTNTNKVKLNTDRLNVSKATKNELDKQTSEVIQSLSNKDIERISKGAGLDTKTNSPEMVKKKIAEQLNVRRDAVLYAKQAEVARKSGDIELAKELLKKSAEQGRISRMQGTELAQQLQARRIIANELDSPVQRVFKLLDGAGVDEEAYINRFADVDFNDAKQVVEAYRDLVPAKASEWLDVVRYNSMLSSPLTQAVNIFGNAQGVLGIAPIEKTLRGAVDAVATAFSGKERQYLAGEGLSYASGAAKNIGTATRNFVDALNGTGKYANPDLQDYSIPLATKGLSGGTYKVLSFPLRVLDGMDKFFRTLSESGEDAALKLRQSNNIKIKGNIDALKEAEAAYRVFQTDLGTPGQGVLNNALDEFASLVMKGRNSKNPIVSNVSKFTVPFVKTINNISKQGFVDYSPTGYVNMLGADDKVTAFTRATMGTATFGMAGLLIGSDRMTWAEPRDPEEKARFKSEGKQAYAVKIGDKWYNYSKLHPAVAFNFAMAAALDDALKDKKTDQSTADAILEGVSKYGNFLADQSYAKSIGDTLGAIGGDKEAVARAVSNYPQQTIPFRAFTGWIARMTDDKERRIDTDQSYIDQQVQSLMQQYPGLRQKTATRDYKGEPIPANNPVLNAFSPIRITDDRGVNPADQAMDAIKEATEKDPVLDKKQTKAVDERVNKILPKAQDELLNNPEFQKLSDADKKSRLNKLSSDIRAVERRKYMAENQVGEYAQDFRGKETKLTKDQTALLSGGVNYSKYTKPTDSKYTEIPAGMNGYDVQTLERFSTLDDQEKEDIIRTEPDAEYKLILAEYERDKKLGKISKVENIKRTNELKKAEVGKTFAKEIREFYSISKNDIYDYISSQPDGQAVAEQLLAYDDALVKAGVIEKNKFRDKYGNIAFASSKSGKGRGGRKGKGVKMPSFDKAMGKSPKVVAKISRGTKPSGKLSVPTVRIANKKVQTTIKTPRIKGSKIA